mmetsp:Transcript_20576/g.47972  ORF Transcript_20576/g.47972 Transcript_20576/m.47972 type:complete len:712 (+) Transcript_20576:81-2216(+)
MEKDTFWELHRKLGECYMHDVQYALSPAAPVAPRLSLQSIAHSGSGRDGEFPNPLNVPKSPPAKMVSFNEVMHKVSSAFDQVVPHADDFGDAAKARASLRERRRSNVECLMSVQGHTRGSSGSLDGEDDQLDITKIALRPHQYWLKSLADQQTELSQRLQGMSRGVGKSGDLDAQNLEAEVAYEIEDRPTMLHPGGILRTTWNVLVALCLVHDLVVIPLYVFDIPDSVALITLEWFTQLFWNFDIFLTVRTGYYYKGLLIMDPKKVFRNYARTWFILDFTLVSVDWCFVFLEASGLEVNSVAQLSRTIRFLRFLRLIRILRWVKLRRMTEMLQELIQDQAASMFFSLIFGIARLIILNHLVACCWFAISRIESADDNWVIHARLGDTGTFHQYAASMNWAFAQLGVGISDITPRTTLETSFCILIAFRSLITCTTLISRMTSLMTALIKTKEDEEKEFRLLRSYLVFNEIPHRLGQKVTRFLQHQFSLRQQAKSADLNVPLLELLSHQLQGELQFARHRPSLTRLEFLEYVIDHADRQTIQVMHELATSGVLSLPVASKDMVFMGGTAARRAYLILNGSFTYYHEEGTEHLDDPEAAGWIAEMCLWTPWVYLGDLVSDDVSRIVALDAAVFGQILSQSQATYEQAKDYAKNFLGMMKDKRYWTDLRQDTTDDRQSGGQVNHHQSVTAPKPKKSKWRCWWSRGRHRVGQGDE